MSRMFYSHFKPIPTKSIRPLANELQKSIATKLKDIRPSAYESQKSIPKKARPLAYESQKSVPKKSSLKSRPFSQFFDFCAIFAFLTSMCWFLCVLNSLCCFCVF